MNCPECRKQLSKFVIIMRALFLKSLQTCPHCGKKFDTSEEFKFVDKLGIAFGLVLAGIYIILEELGRSGYETAIVLLLNVLFVTGLAALYLGKYGSLSVCVPVDNVELSSQARKDRYKRVAVFSLFILGMLLFLWLADESAGSMRSFDLQKFEQDLITMSVERTREVISSLDRLCSSHHNIRAAICNLGFWLYMIIFSTCLLALHIGPFTADRAEQNDSSKSAFLYVNMVFAVALMAMTWGFAPAKDSGSVLLNGRPAITDEIAIDELRDVARKRAREQQEALVKLNRTHSFLRIAVMLTIGLNLLALIKSLENRPLPKPKSDVPRRRAASATKNT